MSVPLLVSNRGYAIFFDNPANGVLSVGRSDNGVRLAYGAETGSLVLYFLVGFLQSTRHFDDTAELRALPRTIRTSR